MAVAVCVVALSQGQVQVVVGAVRGGAAANSGCQSLMLVAMVGLSTFVSPPPTGFVWFLACPACALDATSTTARGSANTERKRLIVIFDASCPARQSRPGTRGAQRGGDYDFVLGVKWRA
jgi:hypothetical protein